VTEDVLTKHAEQIAFARNWRPQTNDDKCITELASEIVRLCERVAGLEADAVLGRMVREMPKETHLIHSIYGDWWFGRNVKGDFGNTGPTPEAVLEAARKGET